jgi:hypothetical protein
MHRQQLEPHPQVRTHTEVTRAHHLALIHHHHVHTINSRQEPGQALEHHQHHKVHLQRQEEAESGLEEDPHKIHLVAPHQLVPIQHLHNRTIIVAIRLVSLQQFSTFFLFPSFLFCCFCLFMLFFLSSSVKNLFRSAKKNKHIQMSQNQSTNNSSSVNMSSQLARQLIAPMSPAKTSLYHHHSVCVFFFLIFRFSFFVI